MPLPSGTKVVGSRKVKAKKSNKCKIQLFGTTPSNKKVHYLETRNKLYPCKK